MLHPKTFLILLGVVFSLVPAHADNQQAVGPNVILILADDLGYGDLSCYGQEKLTTPNIDRLAREGIRFTQAYAGNTVCTPSRAVLMTGQGPREVHVTGNLRNEVGAELDPAMKVLPELFKDAGYATGAFGKWGLGWTNEQGPGNPLSHGFDVFVGWKSQGIAHTYYPSSMVKDGEEIPLEEGTYVHDLIMDEARKFIAENAREGRPFFCYIPTAIPHAAMHAPEDLHRKWRERFPQFEDRIGKYSAPAGEETPDVVNPIAGFAAMMEHLDNDVGSILALLEEHGVAGNTVVIFSSDNGPHEAGGHDPEFWNSNGPLRGIKRDLYEGGIRVPFIVRWPNKVEAGRTSAHITVFQDVLPTMAELLEQPEPLQTTGLSIVLELLGEPQPRHGYLYFEFSHGRPTPQLVSRAVRLGKWKAVQGKYLGWIDYPAIEEQPIELYNLEDDLAESIDLADQYPEVAEIMRRLLNAGNVSEAAEATP